MLEEGAAVRWGRGAMGGSVERAKRLLSRRCMIGCAVRYVLQHVGKSRCSTQAWVCGAFHLEVVARERCELTDRLRLDRRCAPPCARLATI